MRVYAHMRLRAAAATTIPFPRRRGTYRLVHREATPSLRGEGAAASAESAAGGELQEGEERRQGSRAAHCTQHTKPGPGIRLAEEARPQCLFSALDGRVSCEPARMHTHIS